MSIDPVKARRTAFRKIEGVEVKLNDHHINPLTLASAKSMLQLLRDSWAKVEAYHERAMQTTTTQEAEVVQEQIYQPMLEKYIQLEVLAVDIISSLEPQVGDGGGGAAQQATSSVRLPSLELPTFSGLLEDWKPFSDLFSATVGDNSNLTGGQKLQYLKASLKGNALDQISALSTTDENYREAWNILKDKYNNTRDIVHALLRKLIDFKPVRGEVAADLQALVDNTTKCLTSLRVMGRPVEHWDDLLVVLVLAKLDQSTRREWAIKQVGSSLPTLKDLMTFVQGHIRGLQTMTGGGYQQQQQQAPRTMSSRGERGFKVNHVSSSACNICNKSSHPVHQCGDFQRKPVFERNSIVRKLKLCFNCLSAGHELRDCPSNSSCRKCQRRHHTLLHTEPRTSQSEGENLQSQGGRCGTSVNSVSTSQVGGSGKSPATTPEPAKEQGVSLKINQVNKLFSEEVLMTAIVNVKDSYGCLQPCRVFIDPGSQAELISEGCVNRLKLPRESTQVRISGVGGVDAGRARGKAEIEIHGRNNANNFISSIKSTFFIVNSISDLLPSCRLNGLGWNHLNGLELADPEWYCPSSIDILIGIKHYGRIKLGGKILGAGDNEPVAFETIFGWVIGGTVPAASSRVTKKKLYPVTVADVDNFIRKFWEIEEPPHARILTVEEKRVESHFLRTFTRDATGRFHVRISWNEKKSELGASRTIAIKRFLAVERRLQKNPDLKSQYVDFMREYQQLGHMERVSSDQPTEIPGRTLHLCHHGVINESSSTTKLRVVFDGSCPTSSGISMNEAMQVGASLQDDIFDILLRFRVHSHVIKGDITKMFRQFLLHREDADMHRIVWREDQGQPLQDYILRTITYGTACAPNLSTRSLQQLAMEESKKFPVGAAILRRDAFVDDILTGGSSEEEVKQIYTELTEIVSAGGMELRKWSSNQEGILRHIPENLQESVPTELGNDSHHVKALGVIWNPKQDTFTFKCFKFDHAGAVTKRQLLSDLAKVFDPLGFVSCVTVRGKLLLQTLWTLSIGWDERVPQQVLEKWEEFKEDILHLQHIQLPRQVVIVPVTCGIHCFTDSSEKAYGCVIYIRNILPDNSVQVRLVTSKTKVAPLKQQSIPRLELNGCKLGAEVAVHVRDAIQAVTHQPEIHMYTDSTISLTWIQSSPRKWKTYIANRVAAIQELLPSSSWRHVAGVENPADLASRGISAFGGQDLCGYQNRLFLVVHHQQQCIPLTCWKNALPILRFVKSIRSGQGHRTTLATIQQVPAPTVQEMETGLNYIIRVTQQQYFGQEIKSLQRCKAVDGSSKLKTLCPFIDGEGVLRVSGRLQKSTLPAQGKHPIILPPEAHFTSVLIRHTHHRCLHGGFQLCWSQLSSMYWIVRGRDRVRYLIRECIPCRRYRAAAAQQMMGALPSPRVTPARVFLHTGVDYAGPYTLKARSGRGWKSFKGWICLFVCMASKAIHLELAESLSTDSFIAALERFIGRRGLCAKIYSDCGTNFTGADKELQELFTMLASNEAVIATKLGEKGINWHFNPPGAPHHGGLWESGVKSAKHHLRRVIGDLVLTHEQFCTFLCKVEAVLNSRPVSPRSPDPEDLEAITPGHLIIGEALVSLPAHDVSEVPMNRLSYYQLVQNRIQCFWKRWSLEYLNTQQQRTKWMWKCDNVKVGTLVLLVEEAPPSVWKMGRVIETHPGDDGLVRTVTVKTASSVFKRPIVKLIPLVEA